MIGDTEDIEKFWETILKESTRVQNSPQIAKPHLRPSMCAVLSSIFCSFQNRYNRLNVYNASASSSLDRSSNQVTLKGFFLTIHGNNA